MTEPTSTPTSEHGVFINNLSWGTTSEGLKEHMTKAGEVKAVNIKEDYKGRSAGWALVEYTTAEAVAKAIEELNGTVLDERKIRVREDREQGDGTKKVPKPKREKKVKKDKAPKGDRTPTPRVYVGNLPFELEESVLKEHMEKAGTLVKVSMNKGWAIVEYSSIPEAEKAIATITDTEVGGRPVKVREDREERRSATQKKAEKAEKKAEKEEKKEEKKEETKEETKEEKKDSEA